MGTETAASTAVATSAAQLPGRKLHELIARLLEIHPASRYGRGPERVAPGAGHPGPARSPDRTRFGRPPVRQRPVLRRPARDDLAARTAVIKELRNKGMRLVLANCGTASAALAAVDEAGGSAR